MEHAIALLFRSIFVDNMIFAYFLGMCSYLAVSKNVKTSLGLGLAVTFVLVITEPINYLLQVHVLGPNCLVQGVDLSYLSFILFIAIIAGITQLVEMLSLMLVLLAVDKIVLGMLADRFGAHFSTLLCVLFTFSGIVVLTLVKNEWQAVIAVLLLSVSVCLNGFIQPLLAAEIFGRSAYNTTLGIMMAMLSVGGLLSSPLVIMSVVRELLGAGTIGGGLITVFSQPATVMILPAGGFLTLGFVIAVMQKLLKKGE